MIKVINCRLVGLDPGSGYQSSAFCLPYSDLNQVPVSPRGAYSLHSVHYWCKATLHDPSLDQTLPSCRLCDSHSTTDHYSALIFVTCNMNLDPIPLLFVQLEVRLNQSWNTSALFQRIDFKSIRSVGPAPCFNDDDVKLSVMSVWQSDHTKLTLSVIWKRGEVKRRSMIVRWFGEWKLQTSVGPTRFYTDTNYCTVGCGVERLLFSFFCVQVADSWSIVIDKYF